MTIWTLGAWAAHQDGQGVISENGRHGLPLDMNLSALTLDQKVSLGNSSYDPLGGHAAWEVILITMVTASLSLVTVIGNVLVVLSFKVNQQLKTVNNYFLLSLAYADLIIGALSMNLYTTYIIMNHWALGTVTCDLWLALDYVASNASVMNLLVISFDRYFSVTRPLTYRAKRTPRRAAIMIALAWAISFVLWAPAILFWQYIVGQRTVKLGSCYIQFLSEPIITFGTAIAAFYLPITIMTTLYWLIYNETKKRTRELAALQGRGRRSDAKPLGSQRSNSRYNQSESSKGPRQMPEGDSSPSKRNRASQLKSDVEQDNSSCESWTNADRASTLDPSISSDEEERATRKKPQLCFTGIQLPFIKPGRWKNKTATAKGVGVVVGKGSPENGRPGKELDCIELEETNLAKLEPTTGPGPDSSREHRRLLQLKTSSFISLSLKDEPFANNSTAKTKIRTFQKKKRFIIKEKKAAKTLCAILLAFIITWTPYNIMVLVSTFCNGCIPGKLWQLGYWLCYVNSTINPMCYALCNREFRITFKMLLLCQWDKRKWGKQAQRQAVPS
ncbi:muscarinic acetylcholine receptor M1-like [Heptranchias perlo]|uniref:muscarinic acetylcholine receptor M1-like n=1 Tax=Heptranchias perlo TaxID=212740 RepID=UPI00355A2A06